MHTPLSLLVALVVLLVQCSTAASSDARFDGTGCDGQPYPSLEQTPYVLPYPVGKAYRMNLGNCSSSFHGSRTPDRYAYDFNLQIGDTITAARAGQVVYVEQRGTDGDPSVNNLVVVAHSDGTFAHYMHLTFNGADVAVGMKIAAGDVVGRSGATGLAGYPHLHFVVTREGYRWPYDPVPVSFFNTEPAHLVLREGQVYAARSHSR